jgi:hypothetical protein
MLNTIRIEMEKRASASVSKGGSSRTNTVESVLDDKESRKTSVSNVSNSNVSDDWDVVDLKRTPIDIARNERVVYAIAAELVLPMCVVSGLLEITANKIFFHAEVIFRCYLDSLCILSLRLKKCVYFHYYIWAITKF